LRNAHALHIAHALRNAHPGPFSFQVADAISSNEIENTSPKAFSPADIMSRVPPATFRPPFLSRGPRNTSGEMSFLSQVQVHRIEPFRFCSRTPSETPMAECPVDGWKKYNYITCIK
jgi:hypothetical protein